MKLHEFYRMFEDMPKEKRFELIHSSPEPTSLFVIFQQLNQVRAQRKFFEDREEHLLKVAEEFFNEKKDG